MKSEVLGQCASMAAHALRSGISIPAWALEAIAGADSAAPEPEPEVLRAHAELARRIAPRPDLWSLSIWRPAPLASNRPPAPCRSPAHSC
ncbi:MAG: hypothetical protein R3F14_09345 [Polyangiaceae bacterium]